MPTAVRVVASTLVAVGTTEKAASDRTYPRAAGGGDQRRPPRASTAVATANDGPPSDGTTADGPARRAVAGSSEPLPSVVERADGTPRSTERPPPSSRRAILPGCVVVAPGQEIHDRWYALAEREGRYEAPSVQRLIGPADRWREVHLASIRDIVDCHGIDPSMAGAAFALFDRYFMRGLVRGGEWSLALMTCLYLAIKINSSRNNGEGMIDASTMSWECGGQFTPGQVIDMERRICRDLDWRLNPPIPEFYVDLLAPYLLAGARAANDDDWGCRDRTSPTTADEDDIADVPAETRRELVRQSRLLCGMSVLDRDFSVVRPSSIARAAVAVAMDILRFPPRSIGWLASIPQRDAGETGDRVARLRRLCGASDRAPARVSDPSPPSSSGGGDDDDDDDTDASSLTRSDVAPSVVEGEGHVPTRADGVGARHEVGCEDAASAASSKRRRIR
jgi:hypothetical protein